MLSIVKIRFCEISMPTFPDAFPPNCPCGAEPFNGSIFRGCATDPSTEEDFIPHCMSTLRQESSRADRDDCNHWGLSVFTSLDDALHAQELFDWAARWHIFEGAVTSDDGVIKSTPARLRGHHTFWIFKDVSLRNKFTCVATAIK